MRIPFRPTYASVTATLALVVALAGTAVAAGLPARSVGTPQLKNYAVTTGKIANRGVTNAKLAPRAVGPANLSPAGARLARSGPPTTVAGNLDGLPTVVSGAAYRRQSIHGTGPEAASSVAASVLSPARAATAARFRGRIRSDLRGGSSVSIQLVARPTFSGGETPVLGCTVVGGAGPDDTRCASTARVTIPPGSFLYVLVAVLDNGPVSAEPEMAFWSFELTSAP